MVFTKGCDADAFIMAEVKSQRARGAPRVVVVTGDREITESLDYTNAMGFMPTDTYLMEMKRVRSEHP